MNSFRENTWARLIIRITRVLLGIGFTLSGVPKLLGFRFLNFNGETAPIHSAPHLFEVLYLSGKFWVFIGCIQIVAGFMLLSQRFATLGALIYLPIISCIYMLTISYDFGLTYLITGAMLFGNIILIVWDWDIYKILIDRSHITPRASTHSGESSWAIFGVIVFVIALITRGIFELMNQSQ